MKLNVYSMKDTKVGKFCRSFDAPNDEFAKEMLKNAVQKRDPKENVDLLALYPEDFQLFKVATFDEDTGVYTSEIKFIANAAEYKRG